MRKKRLNHNKDIMLGVMALAIAVLGVVVVFWFWCFPDGTPQTSEGHATYKILLKGFQGDSIQLQLDDSLFFSRSIDCDSTETSARISKQPSVLMVMRPYSDQVSSFKFPEKASSVLLQNHDGNIEMKVLE